MKNAVIAIVALATSCTMHPQDVLVDIPQDETDGDTQTDDTPPPADTETLNPSLCTTANATLCDGFETNPVLSPPWFFVNYGSVTTLDTTRFYRGNQSIHFETDVQNSSQGVRQAELTETAAIPVQEFYFRAFIYLPSPAPTVENRLMGLLQVDPPDEGPSVFINNDTLELINPGGETTTTTLFPLDQWVCFEWYVKEDAVNGVTRAWVNDTELTDLAFAGNTDETGGLGRFSFGITNFAHPDDEPLFDIWYDELMLDTARIGCTR